MAWGITKITDMCIDVVDLLECNAHIRRWGIPEGSVLDVDD